MNYGGSTGYGTVYRSRLNGKWGIVDVDDCVNAALDLVRVGEVDGDRHRTGGDREPIEVHDPRCLRI